MTYMARAQDSDAERVTAYVAALMVESPDTISRRPAPSVDEQAHFIRRANSLERAFVLIAREDEEVVGLLDLWAFGSRETRHAASFGMSVGRAWRNRGIGRMLVEAALIEIQPWDGFCRLELEVAAWNAPAIHLYERLGFACEGRKVKAINLRGTPEDLLVMARVW